jgi:electron transport complex protein RnfD
MEQIMASSLFGQLGGRGWEVVNGMILLGGLWLLFKRVITWHVPVAMLGSLFAIATVFHLLHPEAYVTPLFHLFGGGAMLGAFFIATDPVSCATSNRGRLLFGVGVGVLTYIIRSWGGFPDGVAFAVLLMNMVAPTIDYYTRPRVFGQKGA